MKYFKTFISDTKEIYSLDMVRLNIDLGDRLKQLNNYIQHKADYDLRYDIKYYPSFSAFKYRHLWQISVPIDDVSFSLGIDRGGTAETRTKGFIEFNPNKIETSELAHDFLYDLTGLCNDITLVRYDMAIDIPITRVMARLKRIGRKGYQYIDSGNGITEYLGQRNTSGFIKLYDKTKESNLDYDATRLEITLDRNASVTDVFPSVAITNEQSSLLLDTDLDSTDRVLVSLLRDVENPQYYMSELGFRKKKKIAPYLEDTTLLLNEKLAYEIKTLALSYER